MKEEAGGRGKGEGKMYVAVSCVDSGCAKAARGHQGRISDNSCVIGGIPPA